MSRDLTSVIQSALDADTIEPFFAVDLMFDSGELNFWTGYTDQDINGKTYVGAGVLLDISSIEETAEIAAKGAVLTYSGIPTEVLSLALGEAYQGRICKIYFGLVSDPDNYSEIFSGYMDQMNIDESGITCTIELKVENKLIDLERKRVARYTNSYQQDIYPNDKGLEFVEDLQDKKIVWGRKDKTEENPPSTLNGQVFING